MRSMVYPLSLIWKMTYSEWFVIGTSWFRAIVSAKLVFLFHFHHFLSLIFCSFLHLTQTNYWTMVKSVFPVWSEEMREFKRRRNERQSVEASEDFDVGSPGDLPPLSSRSQASLSQTHSDPGGLHTSNKSVSIDPILPRYKTNTTWYGITWHYITWYNTTWYYITW